MTVDEFVIKVGLDPEGVKEGINRTASMLDTGLKQVANVAAKFLAPVTGALAAGELFNAYVNGAAALDRLSDSLDMNIERLQEWQGAARSMGVDAEEVGNIFRDMNDYITDATRFDSGPLKEIAAQLGISLIDVNGAARNSEAVLLDLADAFQAVGSQEATGYGMQLSFDPQMIAMLQQGRNALEEMFREQREYGVYTKRDAEITSKFNKELNALLQSIKVGSAVILRMIVPALSTMMEWLRKITTFAQKHSKFIEAFFITFAAATTAYALPSLKKLAVAAATNPFTLLIAGAAALALVLEDLYGWMNGWDAAFGDFWGQFGTPDEVKAKVEGFIETMKNLGALVLDFGSFALRAASDLAPLIAGLYAAAAAVKVWMSLKSISEAAEGLFGLAAAMEKLKSAFSIGKLLASPFGWVTIAIMAIIAALYVLHKNWDRIKATFEAGAALIQARFTELKQGIIAIWESIKGIFNGAVEWFSSLFSAVVGAIVGKFTEAFDKIESLWNGVKRAFGFDEAAGTTGGLNYIGPLGGDAGQAISPASVSNSSSTYTSDTSVNIGKVEVTTAATDAEGISRDMGRGLQNNLNSLTVNNANTGVRQ